MKITKRVIRVPRQLCEDHNKSYKGPKTALWRVEERVRRMRARTSEMRVREMLASTSIIMVVGIINNGMRSNPNKVSPVKACAAVSGVGDTRV